ncbi:MAG: hypothetical protein OEN01_07815 [Candidatus Krumholzibacteria bacterium]|nr:hypothetical protein [Candidatus Krumholzibacteria bacterium]
MKPSLAVFLHSHSYDRLYEAATLLLTASSMGWRCHLFLFYGALATYVEGKWDDVNIASLTEERRGTTQAPQWPQQLQKSFEQSNVPSLYHILDKARGEPGGVHVCACSASCKTLALNPERVHEKVDEIVGFPTMLRIAERCRHIMYI